MIRIERIRDNKTGIQGPPGSIGPKAQPAHTGIQGERGLTGATGLTGPAR